MDIRKFDQLGEVHSRRPGMTVREVKAEEFDRETLRKEAIAAANEATTAFPAYVQRIHEIFREAFPPHVIATISNWSMVRRVGPDGVSLDGPTAGLEQHHVELLQALLLTLGRREWGSEPADLSQVGEMIETLKSLATAFHRRRALAFEDIRDDPQRVTAAIIQERLRDNTQMVRNWGRYDDMVRIIRELHAPLDGPLTERHGFGATDLVDVADAVVGLTQERLTARIALLDGIMRGRTRKAIVRDFFAQYEGVDGDPDEFFASLSKRTTLRQLRAILQGHATIGLPMQFRVEPELIAERLGKPLAVVAKVFRALSIVPAALRESQPEHLFLANPVWHRPAIHDGDDFLFLLPQTIVGFLPDLLRDLSIEAGLAKRLEKRRAKYLEQEMTRVIAALEAGAPPWRRPWDPDQAGGPAMPRNAVTGVRYRGVNTILLGMSPLAFGSADPRWATYKQAAERGWQVRRGECGTTAYFFKRLEVREADAGVGEGEDATRRIPLLRAFTLFHASQIEGVPAFVPPTVAEAPWRAPDAVDTIVANSSAVIRIGGERAFYSPATDHIQMPPPGAFPTAAGWSSVLIHECSHWTGAASRLNRDLRTRFGSHGYAREEVRAELGQVFVCSELGLPCDFSNAAAYLVSWLEALRSDRKEVFRAAADAQRIADYLLAFHPAYRAGGSEAAADGEPADGLPLAEAA